LFRAQRGGTKYSLHWIALDSKPSSFGQTRLLNHPQVKPLLSDEHFSVDGTLIDAWASQKSFRPKDGSGDDDGGADFHGREAQKRHPCEHQRPEQQALSQGGRAGG
jgi:hypothetical protein